MHLRSLAGVVEGAITGFKQTLICAEVHNSLSREEGASEASEISWSMVNTHRAKRELLNVGEHARRVLFESTFCWCVDIL